MLNSKEIIKKKNDKINFDINIQRYYNYSSKGINLMQSVRIVSIGKYLPKNVILSETLEENLKLPKGWIKKHQGTMSRHWVNNEKSTDLCALALKDALNKADLKIQDIDCIVCASGAMAQLIPCGAALVSQKFGTEAMGIPCFDINATCLSSMVALDTVSYLLSARKYNRIAIVSGDVPSIAIDKTNPKTSTLFGDAGSAMILEYSEKSHIIDAKFETFPEFYTYAQIKGGGSEMPGWEYSKHTPSDYQFQMQGEKIYKYAAKYMPNFFEEFLSRNNIRISDIKFVIPHQASLLSLTLMAKRLNISKDKLFINIDHLGNTVSSSITLALDETIEKGLVKRGDKIILLGTSAGLTLGVMLLEY